MPLPLTIALIILTVASDALTIYAIVALVRAQTSLSSVPTARTGLDLPEPAHGWPPVTIIIPAHNEDGSIAALAQSLLAQDYPSFNVVFALDRCTDSTARILRDTIKNDARFSILEITSCPEDWAGKTHALWRGVSDSPAAQNAELLLFADADTTFDPACLRASVALLLDCNLGLLSLLSTLTTSRWFERVAQPAAVFELMRHFPLSRVNKVGPGRSSFANGQFMLFRRDAYEHVGGHDAVRDELLEDLALARLLKQANIPAGLLLADGMLTCAMYDSWLAFTRGWSRIFIEAAKRRPDRLRAWAAALVITGALLPAAAIACLALALPFAIQLDVLGLIAAFISAGAIMIWIILHALVLRAQKAPIWHAILSPIGALLVSRLLFRAARNLSRGSAVTWAGRSYARPIRNADSPPLEVAPTQPDPVKTG